MTVAIDLASRVVVQRWLTGCAAPSGLALDDAAALLLVGCADGQVAVLDLASDRTLSRVRVSSSIDHIASAPSSRHLFVPDTKTARMTTLSVSRRGDLAVLG